ncbi:uncharacterized protein LOC129601797 [Paramacrobiotus metropolitanus]|uniref:uncharacterized protein LOC129601797 n=1 Tax=Paramacrobiotus metropolitanus TaxID=2943436 RepID=UPI002445A137|nr:uncharacterized protein LOC129601797 [Paramacrobiotus metropolitanus]
MFPTSLPWNSVDVLGNDRHFRYGRVVDVGINGLFIDFLCPSRRREFTPFDRVFFNDDGRYLYRKEMTKTYPPKDLPAEVLMRESASGTWTWFPAQLLLRTRDIALADYSVAIVRRWQPGKLVDVIPSLRIRWQASTDGQKAAAAVRGEPGASPQRPTQGAFVKRSIQLPDGYPAAWVTTAVRQLKKDPNCCPEWYGARSEVVDIVDGCVFYVQRRATAEAQPDDSPAELELVDALCNLHGALLNVVSRIPKPLVNTAAAEAPVLPMKVWVKVLPYLDSWTQARLRPVCTTWNTLLDSAFTKGDVVLDSAAFYQCDLGPVYCMMACLFRYLTSTSNHIVVADRGRCMSEMDVLEVLNAVNFTAQRKAGVRLRGIHLRGLKSCLPMCWYDDQPESPCLLHQPPVTCSSTACYRHWHTTSTWWNSMLTLRSLPCVNIQLIQCALTFECIISTRCYPGDELKLLAAIHVDRHILTDDFGGALWSVMEAGLSRPRDTELRGLSEWLTRNLILLNSTAFQAPAELTQQAITYMTLVRKTLCATQTADPRPTLHYRGKKWCVDGLQELEVEKLSRVALHFLIQLMRSL